MTLSKVIATIITFFWNYFIRKNYIFKEDTMKEPILESFFKKFVIFGASLAKIVNSTVNNKSFVTLKVWGKALENMHFNSQTGLVFSSLTEQELRELLSPEEQALSGGLFGDIVSFLLTLSGVRVALFLHEKDDQVKGSLRTNSDKIDVSKIAKKWGGGGHKKAAGFALIGHLVRSANKISIAS
jgi:phosphoesterase RecJ-like protein